MVMGMPHCVHALDTDALHLISRRFRMGLDSVHGGSEPVHGAANDGCALSIDRVAIRRL